MPPPRLKELLGLLVVVALVAALPRRVTVTETAPPTTRSALAGLDVGRIRLGMPADEVRRRLGPPRPPKAQGLGCAYWDCLLPPGPPDPWVYATRDCVAVANLRFNEHGVDEVQGGWVSSRGQTLCANGLPSDRVRQTLGPADEIELTGAGERVWTYREKWGSLEVLFDGNGDFVRRVRLRR